MWFWVSIGRVERAVLVARALKKVPISSLWNWIAGSSQPGIVDRGSDPGADPLPSQCQCSESVPRKTFVNWNWSANNRSVEMAVDVALEEMMSKLGKYLVQLRNWNLSILKCFALPTSMVWECISSIGQRWCDPKPKFAGARIDKHDRQNVLSAQPSRNYLIVCRWE